MKIRFYNDLRFDPEYSFDLSIIPKFDIFCNRGATCVTIGWIFWNIELWFGKIDDLI